MTVYVGLKEITFRQAEDGRWEVITVRSDGKTETWAGDAPGIEYEWSRPEREVPSNTSYRQFAPGPEVHLTAKLHLSNPTAVE